MARDSKAQAEQFSRGMRLVGQLRCFSGTPAQFWPSLLEATGLLSGAELAVLMRRADGEGKAWQRVGVWPSGQANSTAAQNFSRIASELANSATDDQAALAPLNGSSNPNAVNYGLVLKLDVGSPQEGIVAAFYLPGFSETQAATAMRHLRLVADTPQIYRAQRAAGESQVKLSHFSSVLDLMAILNSQHRYLAVAMTLCNELAARHKCDRVSLGWLEGEYVKLQAISHTEKFEKKMEAVRALEQVMEEALDQDELLVWPPLENDTRINRDHSAYADDQKVKFLCSIPLRLGGETVGVITCERNGSAREITAQASKSLEESAISRGGAFGEDEQRLLSLCGEMAVRRLSELKRTDRWFGARLATATREKLAKFVGIEHTWAKVIAILVAIGLGVLFFGRMNYRVEAPFILRTENVAILTAPFNGFIDEVPVEVGDLIPPGGALLKLDTKDLLLEEASSLADFDRYTREAEKARANNSLAEMRIAEAQAEQARVRLELVRYRLSQAEVGSSRVDLQACKLEYSIVSPK